MNLKNRNRVLCSSAGGFVMNVIPTDILGAEASPGLADDPAARLLLTGFEASPQAQLIIFPLENAVLRANEAACRFFGLTRAELLTTRVSDLYPDSFGELHVASEAAMVK